MIYHIYAGGGGSPRGRQSIYGLYIYIYIIIVHQPQEKVPYAVVANVSEGALELQLRPQEAASLLEDEGCSGCGFYGWGNLKKRGKNDGKPWENVG